MILKILKSQQAKVLAALVAQHNQNRENAISTNVHAAVTSQATSDDGAEADPYIITAAAPTTEATRIALVNDIKAVLNVHFADTIAHDSAATEAVDEDDGIVGDSYVLAFALANALKAAFNTHRSEASVHFTNDGGNAIAAADATTAGSLDTLLTELKADINAHIILAPDGAHIELID
jgi:hypothetical protein